MPDVVRTLVAALMLLATGIAGLPSGALAQAGVYHRGNDGDPETLDPHKTSTVSEAHLLRDLFEGLVIHDGLGRVVPGVAERWEITPDGRLYRFHLRANAKWSNGEAVKAGDFVYSLRRIMAPDTGAKYANILYPIQGAEKIARREAAPETLGVKAVDDRTLEITLERATPYFLELLTHQTGLPVHPGNVTAAGKDFVRPGTLVSNGAYRLVENVPNSHILLEKNQHFHDAANVRIPAVRYHPIKDLAAAARRFMAGELHSTSDFPADQYKFLKDKLGSQVVVAPYLGTYYLAFNTERTPFGDVRVRTALSMAIDREFLNDYIFSATMVPAYGFIPPGIGNYGAPAEMSFKALAPIEREERARQLLADAGYGPKKPLKVEIRYNITDNNRNAMVAIADMWKSIGVETTFISTDAKTHFAYLRDGGAFDVARAGWIGDYSDPQNFLFLVQSDNPGFNYARYKNPEFDVLMKEAGAETDLAKRALILLAADRMFVRDQPFAPLLFYSSRHLISPKLKGLTPNLRGANATRFMSLEP
ncbi:MAG TPA: peptide ABC transporter substrate-binding protein [Hyphomicrobiaceae bacterium]|nr:peptide ABC transporter substrate-binding protein [Hyphomicrobiaceae bacterium]